MVTLPMNGIVAIILFLSCICPLQVNLLDRIKSVQVKREISEWLDRLLRRYDRTGKVMEIFS